MKNKFNKNHKIILIVISILLLFCVTIGISYAYWQITHKQKNANIINSGCFEVTFEETGSDITLTNAFPISNQKGLALTPYKFKIKNTCTIDSEYYVTLNSFGETSTLLNENSIKYAFDFSTKTSPTPKILGDSPENSETSNIDINNLIKSYYLKGGYLRALEEIEFSLYLWVDQDAPMSEMNKKFASKIYITNVATDEAPLIANLRMATSGWSSTDYLNGPLTKDSIEKLEFVSSNKVPDDAIGSWDVSAQQNGGIMAWYYDTDSNDKYEVYIGQKDGVIANSDSSYLFENLTELKKINLSNLDTSNVTDMSYMFYYTGETSSVFTLDLGENFDTANVTDMSYMFYYTGYRSTAFTLDLGSNFNTSNVTNMSSMFYYIGNYSTVFTLDLGNNFDTSKVINMDTMFSSTGSNSLVFTLDLGNNFDTARVTNMNSMFFSTGGNCPVFTLDLGEKFDTSNVTTMSLMFNSTGNKNPDFTLDLGNKFDTSKVTSMSSMFYSTGYRSTVFTLDLGDKFDTSKVTDMSYMFDQTGYSNAKFTLDLGEKFDTSNVTNMRNMFSSTGWNSTVFTLNFGSKFDTSKVTNMGNMFSSIGGNNSNLILDLRTFDFDKVTNFSNIFFSSKTTYTAYVKNAADKTLISEKGFKGTIIDCSTNTCS